MQTSDSTIASQSMYLLQWLIDFGDIAKPDSGKNAEAQALYGEASTTPGVSERSFYALVQRLPVVALCWSHPNGSRLKGNTRAPTRSPDVQQEPDQQALDDSLSGVKGAIIGAQTQ